MSIPSRARRALPFSIVAVSLALALLVQGCGVDERTITVIPDPIVIDTFEDGTMQPMDRRFNLWAYNAYSAFPWMRSSLLVQPGFQSNWCLSVTWEMTDPPDGVRNNPGFVARTQALGSVDLAGYTTFSFAHLDGHDGDCKGIPGLVLTLFCRELAGSMSTSVPLSPTWASESIALSSFRPEGARAEDCLKVIDMVGFFAIVSLADGDCASGSLLLDDVIFR